MKMPFKLKRCGHCTACRGKVCHPTRGTRCTGCKFPARKEGCHLRQPCVKQASNTTHFAAMGGETTSASESESNTKHRYPTRLSMSDNDESEFDPASTAMEAISTVVSKLDHITLADITTNVPTGASSTPVGGCSEVDSLDRTLIENEVLPNQTTKAILPPYLSNWEMSQVSDHNFSQVPPMRPILRNSRRESNIHVPLNAISTPTKTGQSVTFTPPALGTIKEQSSHDNINPNGDKSNNNPVLAIAPGLISAVDQDAKSGSTLVAITAPDGTITEQKISKGLNVIAKPGQAVTKDTLLTTDPNIGGFGQAETEIVLQNPDRIIGYLVFCLAVVLCQIFLVIKKKQFEKVQAAEMNF